MKIFSNQSIKYSPWGGGAHFFTNLAELLIEKGHDVIFNLKKNTFRLDNNIDLILIIKNFEELNPNIIKYKNKFPTTKVLHRINECDKRKNTDYVDEIIFNSNKIANTSVFISNWLANYFVKKGFKKSYKVIYNGCNSNFFYPQKKKELGEVINLVTHHWSSNWMKGFDIYTELDKILGERNDISFTYIGRYYNGYTPKNTKLIPPFYGARLGEELRKYDIYLTASRWEPCGMHHIEGASCGLPVLYHQYGGGINESCKNYGLDYKDIPSLLEGINKIKNSYQEYRNKIPYEFLSASRCCEDYYNIIMEMFNS